MVFDTRKAEFPEALVRINQGLCIGCAKLVIFGYPP